MLPLTTKRSFWLILGVLCILASQVFIYLDFFGGFFKGTLNGLGMAFLLNALWVKSSQKA